MKALILFLMLTGSAYAGICPDVEPIIAKIEKMLKDAQNSTSPDRDRVITYLERNLVIAQEECLKEYDRKH